MNNVANIDPMGSFVLTGKVKKALDKGKIAGVRIEFLAGGARAVAALPLAEGETAHTWAPIVEVMASISNGDLRPFAEEKAHLVSKYEVRLDEEAPEGLRAAADKSALEAAVAGLPFRKRRALQMSNKEFELAFLRWEGGNPVPRPAEQAEALRLQRATATRGGSTSGRGRGRGGRGRGSFLGAQGAPPEGPASVQNAQ